KGAGLVESVLLFDVYEGPQVGEGRKSLAFAIRYRHPDRTLSDREIQPVHDALVAELHRALGAELRGCAPSQAPSADVRPARTSAEPGCPPDQTPDGSTPDSGPAPASRAPASGAHPRRMPARSNSPPQMAAGLEVRLTRRARGDQMPAGTDAHLGRMSAESHSAAQTVASGMARFRPSGGARGGVSLCGDEPARPSPLRCPGAPFRLGSLAGGRPGPARPRPRGA